MTSQNIKAKFNEFSLPQSVENNSSAIIPTVKGTLKLKYGKHAYYFYNFKALKGFCVEISHLDIIKAGLNNFHKANYKKYRYFPILRSLFQKFHYGFIFLEQIMLMTVPHTATPIGNGRFLINLWSYYGYLLVDCRKKTVEYKIIEENNNNHVLGSQQWHDPSTDELYYITYSLKDSLKRSVDPYNKVFCKILKQDNKIGKTEEVWSGDFADNMHEIIVNENRQYLAVCELGMFLDDKKNLIPSKVLILDLKNKKQWVISRFLVAAHAQFDPDDPDIIYFSNHNFQFQHSNIFKLLKNASYSIKFFGPASVHKYRLTQDGPKELGIFTDPEMFRLTNVHVFRNNGRKIIAAVGSPNFIFIADADNMKLIKKIEINNKNGLCRVGTFSPSSDGEKLYVQTNKSFQIIDLSSGKPEFIKEFYFTHTCANHMMTSSDINW